MRSALGALAAVALTLLLGGAVLKLLGIPPLEAATGALASCAGRLPDTAAKALCLTLLGTGVAVAFRAGFWNVGAEGQLCAGAVAAAGVGLFVAPAGLGPSPVLWAAATLAVGALAGALWCWVPAVLRARWQVNEVVTTLMLFYVARRAMEYLYLGPWKDPKGFGFPGTAPLAAALAVPTGRLLVLAALLAVLCQLLVSKTTLGYEMAVLGESRDAAHYAGIRSGRVFGAVALVSGGLAGLTGAVLTTSIAGRLISGISVGDGFAAVILACLAGRQPLAVLLVAPFWAVLKVGAQDLELSYRVPQAFSTALEGACLLCWLVASRTVRLLPGRNTEAGRG